MLTEYTKFQLENERISPVPESNGSKRPFLDPKFDPHELCFYGLDKRGIENNFSAIKTIECPRCFGYGGWHLILNDYGPGKHFNQICNNCHGSGWVPASQGSHIHKWVRTKNIGVCYNQYECSCGQIQNIDSSD